VACSVETKHPCHMGYPQEMHCTLQTKVSGVCIYYK
jgi:hypothetical protein